MNTGKIPPQEASIISGSTKDWEIVPELYLTNLPQDVITTTEDKVRLCLSEYLKKMEKKKGWLTPMGLTISFTLTLMASQFRDWGLSSATWQAIFIIGVVASSCWLVYSVIESFHSVKIEDVITKLRKQSDSMIKFVKK